MKKLLIDVRLPATGESHEFWVADDLSVQQVTEYVAEAMQVAEPSFYRKTPDAALMLIETGQIQVPTAIIGSLGIPDGTRFVLV